MIETIQVSGQRIAGDAAAISVGERREFSVPSSNIVSLNLDVYLIIKPLKEDLEYAYLNKLDIESRLKSRIIFSKKLNGSASFNREIFDGEATVVSGTQSLSARKYAIDTIARNLADSFERIVINAF